MILINIIVIVVLIAALFGGYFYFTNATNYVSTSDASVTGTIVPITVPFSGRLASWDVTANSTVSAGLTLGTESDSSVLAMNGGLAAAVAHDAAHRSRLTDMETITSPIDGTVIQNNVVPGQVVQPGQTLAQVVNLSQLTVTANVPETQIRHVQVGQTADVTVSGIPNTTFRGTVQRIGDTTTSIFSLVPNLSAASGSYTKVVQRIPVVIDMGGYSGQPLLPGMNAQVSIHVNSNL